MPKEDTQFKKGQGGRKTGVKNKINRTMKELVLFALNKIQDNPKVNIVKFAETYPRDFYQIASRLIPSEVQNQHSGQIIKRLIIEDASGCEPLSDTPGTEDEGNPGIQGEQESL